ncbi:MAG TPA: ABC-F family ATP-binding cassette domain-containing protein [Candidatus Dormibacteraeota bacterium]
MSTATLAAAALDVEGLTLETSRRILIDGARFSVGAGRRVALVGRNGSGKTSLLEAILARLTGTEPPEHLTVRGSITAPEGATCGYLGQHPAALESAATVAGYLESRAGERARLHGRYDALTADPEAMTSTDGLAAYGDVVDRLTTLAAWEFPAERDTLLAGMGLGAAELQRLVSQISGGEATKVALAGLLLAQPDLLLLDEPTNNLDDRTLGFVRDWLRGTPSTVLLISHDRDFLDDTVDGILDIDEETGGVTLYEGGYSAYAATRAEEFAEATLAFAMQAAQREALEASAAMLSGRGQSFEDQSDSGFHHARGAKVARRASVQRRRIERQLSDLTEPQPPRRPDIVVPRIDRREGALLSSRGLAVGHPGSPQLLGGLSFALEHGQRIAISGPNGSGKTTLLRVLAGDLPPLSGTVERDPGARTAYLPQSVADPDTTMRVVDHARRVAAISEDDVRELLAGVVFTDIGDFPMACFSAGERRRIELAVFFASRPDLIFLDEPTNHLDLPTIEILERALRDYRGAIVTVCHDRRFLASLGLDGLLLLDGQGGVEARSGQALDRYLSTRKRPATRGMRRLLRESPGRS